METMYQRNKIQEESIYYETMKHTGEYPIIGVNTFLAPDGSPTMIPGDVFRASYEEKNHQLYTIKTLHNRDKDITEKMIAKLRHTAVKNENVFEALMEVTKHCSLGQITHALFEVGGQYRRSM